MFLFILYRNLGRRGGLLHPTYALYGILSSAEKVFRVMTHNKPDTSLTLPRLRNFTLGRRNECNLGFERIVHEKPAAYGEAPHEYSLAYSIISLSLKIRLHHYEKLYTIDVLNRKVASSRNQSARLTIFKHILCNIISKHFRSLVSCMKNYDVIFYAVLANG